MQRLRNLAIRILPAVMIALLFGALAPQGFMPHLGPQGLTIELCSGLGNREATVSRDDPRYADYLKLAEASGSAADQNSGNDADNPLPPCAFAGLATLAIPADPVAVPQMLAAQDVPPALHHSLLRARHHAATPPATGPPSLT